MEYPDHTDEQWYRVKRTVPVFSDSGLENASVIHRRGCRASSVESGVTPVALCNNRFCSDPKIDPSTPVRKVMEGEHAVLVQTQTSGPFWIESGFLEPSKPPEEKPERRSAKSHRVLMPPPDYLMADTLLGEGPIRLPRRRRRVNGGEIVFVRSELSDRAREPMLWRFFALTFDKGIPSALIIDASIPFDGALNPGWAQYRSLPLIKNGKKATPEQFLIPVFPLPDGRQDPGWRSEQK